MNYFLKFVTCNYHGIDCTNAAIYVVATATFCIQIFMKVMFIGPCIIVITGE